jgi:hypothetical protein
MQDSGAMAADLGGLGRCFMRRSQKRLRTAYMNESKRARLGKLLATTY